MKARDPIKIGSGLELGDCPGKTIRTNWCLGSGCQWETIA